MAITPGEWTVISPEKKGCTVTSKHGDIALVAAPAKGRWQDNAALIAAAPDLIAAVAEAAEQFDLLSRALAPHNKLGEQEFGKLAAKMRAAVAKAAGR